MSIRALKAETAQLAAEASDSHVRIAVPGFHSFPATIADEQSALEYNRDQLRLEVEAGRDRRQKHQWNVAIVAAELGVNESIAADMFRDKPEQRVLLLATEAAYGSNRDERNEARAQLKLNPETKDKDGNKTDEKKGRNAARDTQGDDDDEDDGDEPVVTTGLGLYSLTGWRGLALLAEPVMAPAPMSGGRAGRRARMRGMQAEADTASAPVVMSVAPGFAPDFF